MITNAVSWSKERNRAARRAKQLQEASDRLDFWKKWLELDGQISANEGHIARRKFAETQLMDAFDEVASLYKKETPEERYERFAVYRNQVNRFRKWLLLYRPLNARAWVTRTVFYAYLLFIPCFVLMNVRVNRAIDRMVTHRIEQKAFPDPTVARQHEYEMIHNLEILGFAVPVVVLGLALIFRAWSFRMETQGFQAQPLILES